MNEAQISDAEWQVMQVVWEKGSATAAEVIAALTPATKWQHRTIRTLLARLVDKRVLATETEGNRYLYRALIARSSCVREESRSFLKKVFGGDAAELLVHFVRRAEIPPERIEELKQLLDEKKPSSESRRKRRKS
jgi:BlaI family transcriptional regulator, penicillinase repressor